MYLISMPIWSGTQAIYLKDDEEEGEDDEHIRKRLFTF